MDAGDKFLEEHVMSAMKNAAYASPIIQNEVIDAIGEIIRKRIVTEVNAAKFFSALADEARDVSRTNQLTVCLRYVTPENGQEVLRENFLFFCVVETKTDAALAESI